MPTETPSLLFAFLPEWILLLGVLGLFVLTLGVRRTRAAHTVSLITAALYLAATLATFGVEATLFDNAYRVDNFSQILKLLFGLGYLGVLWIGQDLPDIRRSIRPEYFFLLATSMVGFTLLAGSMELITIVVALELSSFPLFLLIAMRREETGHRIQMEATVKYMMFGIGASGIMLFGMAYLYGLTGTTSLPLLLERLQPLMHTPLAIAGLALTLAAFFYKLAVFPFHFWTPDVYQGAANETTTVLATLPKIAAVLLLLRFLGGVGDAAPAIAQLVAVLAILSLFYGNLLALLQDDLKRLLGFSAIAHAGFILLGLVALEESGYTAALYYTTGYLFMILACFAVITRVSKDGANLPIQGLAGLHRRSPLLAATLLVGIFSLAGIPPFVGFMGKFALLTAAFHAGFLWLVLLALLNTVIAAYYYLRVIHVAFFTDPTPDTDTTPIILNPATQLGCLLLIAIILGLGILPGPILETLAATLTNILPAQ